MPDQSWTDEELKDRAIEQVCAGDIIGARQIVSKIIDREYLREVWLAILGTQAYLRDLQGVKDTIVACPDDSLLRSHLYHELPLVFARAGNFSGAIEIAIIMGPRGIFSLVVIAVRQASKGDFVGAREAMVHIHDEGTREAVHTMVSELHRKGQNPGVSSKD